jgi:hypothetical protein
MENTNTSHVFHPVHGIWGVIILSVPNVAKQRTDSVSLSLFVVSLADFGRLPPCQRQIDPPFPSHSY